MTTRKSISKRVPPARVWYEAANPTVSVRISQELKQELEDLKITTGMSMAEILKAGLDKIQPDAEGIYERGYVDGYEIAEERVQGTRPVLWMWTGSFACCRGDEGCGSPEVVWLGK